MQIVQTRLLSQVIHLVCACRGKRELYGSEEVRLAPLAPLSASMLQSTTKQLLFFPLEILFRNSLNIFSGSGDPDSLFGSLPPPRFPQSNYTAPAPDK